MGLFFLVSVITQPQSAEARYLSYCDTSNKIEYLVELRYWLLLCRSCFYVYIKSVGGEVRKVRKSCYNSVFAGVVKTQSSTVVYCVNACGKCISLVWAIGALCGVSSGGG